VGVGSVKWGGEWHPATQRVPMWPEDALRRLAASIAEVGQLVPCTLDPDGLGLDGRNRHAACQIAEVETRWQVYEGPEDDPRWRERYIEEMFIQSRPEITTGQRAMLRAISLYEDGQRGDGRWTYGSGKAAPQTIGAYRLADVTWRTAMKQAGVVIDWLPGTEWNAVVLGTKKLETAYKEAAEVRDEQTRRTTILADLTPDLAALVEAGVRDLDDAQAEGYARKVVARIDTIRDGDGAPPPSFAARVEMGDMTWPAAVDAAEQWETERTESLGRDRTRLRGLIVAWPLLREIRSGRPYAIEAADGMEPAERDRLETILTELAELGGDHGEETAAER
jgi:hypothetical protein